MTQRANLDIIDIFVIGGGINGTGIALDAAGRGLKVLLCEQADLGSATSSNSSKLIHGGLRYSRALRLSLGSRIFSRTRSVIEKSTTSHNTYALSYPSPASSAPRMDDKTGVVPL